MNQQQMASKIPSCYYEKILKEGMLERAFPGSPDETVANYVHDIGVFYKDYLDPNYDSECNHCVAGMIKAFKWIKAELIESQERLKDLERKAVLIPPEDRRELLELEMIDTAQAVMSDMTMHLLVEIWTKHIEYDFKPECDKCLPRVLKCFKEMKPVLIEMENSSRLLKTA